MELGQRNATKESNTGLLKTLFEMCFPSNYGYSYRCSTRKVPTENERLYKEAREAIKQFRIHFQSPRNRLHQNTHEYTWLDKYPINLSFDFEVAVSLQQLNDLETIIEASKPVVSSNSAPSSSTVSCAPALLRRTYQRPSRYAVRGQSR
ncbi:hypothetical protein BDW75DRAFT_86090 [Aspergillus navahoensis]